MTALYLDSSAFVKLVVEEPETAALRSYLAKEGQRRVSSALLRTEALRAVRRLGAEALATVREGLRRVDLVGIDDRILDAAGTLEPGVLRTLDAIHLATAQAIGEDLDSIVTYDERMIEGARLLGLPTEMPR
ncbi:MAG TPA: type II toxin-antitoxin system VapC family toxin [Candidatus Limnocylindrales bacterium]|nr:type II toxin-antitoxin system VapC family toxin [Candidatus Limnocylindrales bacterium]